MEGVGKMPQKKFYRSRAHCNPLAHNTGFKYPLHPKEMDWSPYYPQLTDPVVRHLDVGCGFGGLTIALATLFPEKVVLGLEIRAKVCEYVRRRIQVLREESENQSYLNASCFRTNCMRYLPNYFECGQLEKIFFCFPDPHFKAKNHRRRIVSESMLNEYAYLLQPGGRLYTITDVEDLHNWHVEKCTNHPYFERISDEELNSDPCIPAMINETEEGKKVSRMNGNKYYAVFRRRTNEETSNKLIENSPVFTLFLK